MKAFRTRLQELRHATRKGEFAPLHAVNCVFLTLALCAPAVGKTHHVRPVQGLHAPVQVGLSEYGAVGDSLALGFGHASGFETHAVVGEPSCPHGRWPGIVNMVPAKHFKFLLISAGIFIAAVGYAFGQIRRK